MHGIRLLEVAKILGTAASSIVLLDKHGAIGSIIQEIGKYAAQQDIVMVKVTMLTLSQQNERAYKEAVKALEEHFSPEELEEILPK